MTPPPKINIICSMTDAWILRRLAAYLAENIDGATLVDQHDHEAIHAPDVALNYYVNDFCLAACGKSGSAITAVFFDHPKGDRYYRQADAIVCMTPQYRDAVDLKVGIPCYLAIQPTDTQAYTPKLRVGFVGRFQGECDYSRRKGKPLLDRVAALPYVELTCTLGRIPEEDLPAFYRSQDAIVVTSTMEGGPMCLTEALACGVPVVMPRTVGVAELFSDGVIHYDQGDWDSLERALARLYSGREKLASLVRGYDWQHWAEQHRQIFGRILGHARPDTCLYTTAIGRYGQELGAISIPFMRRYADRHGWDLHVFRDQGAHATASWVRLDIGKHMRAHGYRRALYLDLDTVIHPDAPNIFEQLPTDGWDIAAVDHGAAPTWDPGIATRNIRDYCRFAKLQYPAGYDGRAYFNAGVLAVAGRYPDWEPGWAESPHGCQDQNALNLAALYGDLRWHRLGTAWNLCHVDQIDADIYRRAYVVHCNQMDLAPCSLAQRRLDLMRAAADAARGYQGPVVPRSDPHSDPLDMRGVHVRFVSEPGQAGWILERMQRHIEDACTQAGISHSRGRRALDQPQLINYYNPYRYFGAKSRHALDVVFCTHPELTEAYYAAARTADHVVVMCRQYQRDLIAQGVPASRVTLVYPGVDTALRDHRLRVLIPSRMTANRGYEQRKGVRTWQHLQQTPWLHVVCTEGRLTEPDLLTEYRQADAIVSTATMEGGPMCAVEGLALGKPTFVRAGVGLAPDLAGLSVYADDAQLLVQLGALYEAKRERAESVANLTWANWAAEHLRLFSRLAAYWPADLRTVENTPNPLKTGCLKMRRVLPGQKGSGRFATPPTFFVRTAVPNRENQEKNAAQNQIRD